MVRRCCVPGCRESLYNVKSATSLHSLPYTNKPLWKHWTILCPFLLKYTNRQLDHVVICKKHFIPEHYDYEKRRLKWCSLPLLHVPGIKIVRKDNNKYTFLEINPMKESEPLDFKVVTPCSLVKTKNTNEDLTEAVNVTQQHSSLLILKAEDSHGLPVDHSMYCSPPEASHNSLVTAEPSNIKCMAETSSIVREPIEVQLGAASGTPNGGLNTYAVTYDYTECHEQVTKQVSAAGQCSVTDDVSSLIQSATFNCDTNIEYNADTDSYEDYSSTLDLYNILTGITHKELPNNIAQENKQFQAQVLQKAEDKENLFTCDSTNMKGSVEIPAISLKEKFIEPYTQMGAGFLSDDSKLKIYYENAFDQSNNQFKFNNKPPVMITNKAVQLTQCNSQTQESLLAQPNQISSAGKHDRHPFLTIGAPSETVLSTTYPTYYQSMQKPSTQKKVTSHSEVCKCKENSKCDEKKIKALHERCKNLKKKLYRSNKNCRRLRLRLDGVLAKSKQFLKAYPRLSSKTREVIETQLRLAGQKPKGARYSDEEKLFAQRLYQISPDCYRFLRQYLQLPGKSMVQRKDN